MKHPDEIDVMAPCGCWLAVEHRKGDRLQVCDHGKRWKVSAKQPATVYEFDELVTW